MATSHPDSWGPGWPVVALRGTTQVGLAFSSLVPVASSEYETWARVGWSESSDGGATWTPEELISDGNPMDFASTVLWRSGGDLYVMWRHFDYDDGGSVQLRVRH